MSKIFIFLILVSFLAIFIIQEILLPKNRNLREEKIFSIEKGESAFEINENLQKEGLIKNRFFLDFYLILTGNSKKLQAGQYKISASMNIPEIANKIVLGEIFTVKITIPEGYNLKQIEDELIPIWSPTVLEHFKIKNFKKEFNFLTDAPDEANLEGFLFPDTYFLNPAAPETEIVKYFLNNFEKKLTAESRREIKNQEKTIFEIITMASLIEKEVQTMEDKETVSGILWKRLENNIPLQIDATIAYLTGKKTTKVSREDTQIDSPYNTYKYAGLPLGPISNPGIDSIVAAIYPKNNNYWYYLSTPEGKTIFSKTLEEHNLAKAKYLK